MLVAHHIEAGDLASHTYNAWLAQLIEHGQANGLWIARQWNNVLFDIALTRLADIVGLRLAEKIIVSSAVLIFFWSSFALTSSFTARPPWRLAPCLAILSYGWAFEMGFMNYLSLGLAFLSLAIIIRGKGWKRAHALLLLPVTWMAHPLGAAVLVGVGTYICIARALSTRHQASFLLGNGVFLAATCLYLRGHYQTMTVPRRYLQTLAGADQLVLFGEGYSVLASIFLAFCRMRGLRRYSPEADARGAIRIQATLAPVWNCATCGLTDSRSNRTSAVSGTRELSDGKA